jgi:ketosteroid isomerase-like protein
VVQAVQNLTFESDAETLSPADTTSSAAVCAVCGSPNAAGNKFCSSCGVPFDEATRVSPAARPAPGQHHYHHHYHHHYISGGEGLNAHAVAEPRTPSVNPVVRDAARIRATQGGAVISRAEAAVRQATQDWAFACNTRHLDDLVSLYSTDAIALRPNVAPVRGIAAIREFLVSLLDSGFGDVEMEQLRVEIFGDVAYDAGRCKMLAPIAVGKRREERGKYLIVYTRSSSGDWKIVSDCWSSDLSLK